MREVMYETDSPLIGRIRNAVQPIGRPCSICRTSKLQTQAQPEVETFFGTVLKNGQNFVLSDSATKSKYSLDDPKKASRYEGMTVKVTGTIDLAINLIHVETIQPIVKS